MKSISAGIAAAGIALLINKRLIRSSGGTGILVFISLVEETVKAALSILCGANVLVTHITFGLSEAVYDMASSSGASIYAAVVSVVGHTFCGYVYLWIKRLFSSDFAGLSAAVVLHLGWNLVVVYNSKRQN